MNYDLEEKLKESEEIKRQTEEYLAKGGKITVLKSIKTIGDFIADKGHVNYKKVQAVNLYKSGKSINGIALALGYNKSTIEDYVKGIKRGSKKDSS